MLRRCASSSTVRRSRRRLQEPEAPEPPQDLDRRVRPDAEDREERLPGPVAAEQDDPRAQRPERRARVELAAVAGRAACRRARRRRAPAGTAPARSPRRPRCRRSRPSRPRGRSARSARPAGPRRPAAPRAPAAASCRSGNASWSGRPIISATRLSSDIGGGVERSLADAVAEHGDAIGDPEHLRQAVADVDDADAGAALLEHERVQPLDVLRPERRRRLVEEQHLRPGEQRLDHLEELPVCERQRARRRRHRDVEPELREPRRSPLLHPPVRRLLARAARRGRGSRATDRSRTCEYVWYAIPRPSLRASAGEPCRRTLPADLDAPSSGCDEAARDPEQCRFPGPVLPDERVDLAGAAVDADLAKRLYRSERLRHASKRQTRGRARESTCCLAQVLVRAPPTDTSSSAGDSGMSDVAEASCG